MSSAMGKNHITRSRSRDRSQTSQPADVTSCLRRKRTRKGSVSGGMYTALKRFGWTWTNVGGFKGCQPHIWANFGVFQCKSTAEGPPKIFTIASPAF